MFELHNLFVQTLFDRVWCYRNDHGCAWFAGFVLVVEADLHSKKVELSIVDTNKLRGKDDQ